MSFIIPDSAKKDPSALLKWAAENDVAEIDVRFVDVRGIGQHFSMPIEAVDTDTFEEGFGFDGSSVRGFQNIHESDMILKADLDTAYVDPFFGYKTIAIVCDVYDPITLEPYNNDPRRIARRAEAYLQSTGIADTAFFGPEAEFFMFSNVKYNTQANTSMYEIDSHEGFWNTASDVPEANYLNRIKEGYFPLPPLDKTQDIRAEMTRLMMDCGIPVEVHHHEVGGAGQAEIDMKFDTMLAMADKLMLYKYIVRNVAANYGLIATFMPKPLFEDNGSGMHVHQSLWKDGKPLFYDENGYGELSDIARWYIGGILKHAHAVIAFTNPTTNSFRRLVPGYEAPVNLAYSLRNRSAAIRVPMYSHNPKAKRIETRFPDPTCNPYLAFPALLMAGLDGVKNQIDPGDPVTVDLYEGGVETPVVPRNLHEALLALEADYEFLLEGNVFTEDYIKMYVDYKQTEEADQIAMRPHPYEFRMYLDF